MPLIILAIRVEIEIIFKMNYRSFLTNKGQDEGPESANQEGPSMLMAHQSHAFRLINGVITEIFDPNLFYSRLSFLESGKEAIDIKSNLNQGKAHNGYRLPNIQSKFYTRSALVKNLIPIPSDGMVRAKFKQASKITYPMI